MKIFTKIKNIVRYFLTKNPRMYFTYRMFKESKSVFDVPKNTPMGFKFSGNLSMENGSFETEEYELVKSILDKTDVFINVGANIGYYICLALNMSKYTIACEPIESNLRLLYKNIDANKWKNNLEVYPLALSNNIGIIKIYGSGVSASLIKGWGGTKEPYKRFVSSSTLDHIIGNRFLDKRCFLLVDIEGAEMKMLEGSRLFFERYIKPVCFMEISITEHQPDGFLINPYLGNTFNFFWEKGYEAFTADKEKKLILPEEIKTICNTGIDTILKHNFMFVWKENQSEILH